MSAAGASQELLMRGGGWRQASTAQLYNHDVATLAEAVARLPDTKPPAPERPSHRDTTTG